MGNQIGVVVATAKDNVRSKRDAHPLHRMTVNPGDKLAHRVLCR
jgi:hypothetical protein